MHSISLTASMRSNLLSLQSISKQVSATQNRLATGKKVNSAIDNPQSFYTARSLSNRSNDLSILLDSVGQAVSTIKTANEALDIGTSFLEQAKSAAMQAMDYADYKVVTVNSDITADKLESLMQDNVKIVLKEDITLDRAITLSGDNLTINGNGHKITYKGADSAIKLQGNNAQIYNLSMDYNRGDVIPDNNIGGKSEAAAIELEAGASADISYIKINSVGEKAGGILVGKGAVLKLDNGYGIEAQGAGAQRLINGNAEIYDGKYCTDKIISQLGDDALAASACNKFYVTTQDGEKFGEGQWYLPSIGELENMYGTDVDVISKDIWGKQGATGDNKDKINNSLKSLQSQGVEADILRGNLWSSSTISANVWTLSASDGSRAFNSKNYDEAVRGFMVYKDCYKPDNSNSAGDSQVYSAPQIGDVMYSDGSYGSAENYDNSKTAVGIIADISADGRDAKIVSLKNLHFSNNKSVGNFNPDDPYQGKLNTNWCTSSKRFQDIRELSTIYRGDHLSLIQSHGTILLSNTNIDVKYQDQLSNHVAQFNEIINQYDSIIHDAHYKGINLLKSGNDLNVRFNENGSSSLELNGQDMSSEALGLLSANWVSQSDIEESLHQISKALNSIRSFASELGNNFTILTNRQDFTNAITNVLTEGADKLILADINEQSANMLSLQTCQQIATNSLSLASQSSQAVLRLF